MKNKRIESSIPKNPASRALRELADPKKAILYRRFFKTGPGDYGEGDQFLGVIVPRIRAVAKQFCELPISEAEDLLRSPFHEERMLALCILMHQYDRGDNKMRAQIYDLYLANAKHINNWDLVDATAPHIVGRHLEGKSKTILFRLAKSKNLWKRRITILSSFWEIRRGRVDLSLALAKKLLHDPHDLMHKAIGWMLREVEKKDGSGLRKFLDVHAATMPRTMLRYAIERFPETKRKKYLQKRT